MSGALCLHCQKSLKLAVSECDRVSAFGKKIHLQVFWDFVTFDVIKMRN